MPGSNGCSAAYYTKEHVIAAAALPALQPRDPGPASRGQLTLGANTFPEFVQLTLDSTYEEIAGFLSVTAHVTDHFDITAGGRYSHNSQSSTAGHRDPGPAGSIITAASSEDVFTWSIAPRYQFNDRVAIYARVAKGYRPGGPNAVAARTRPPTSRPLSWRTPLVSYEAGLRAQTADHVFSFDASVFRLDWNNILINDGFTDPATGTQFGANGNGRRARSEGAEFVAHRAPGARPHRCPPTSPTPTPNCSTTPRRRPASPTSPAASPATPCPITPRWSGTLSGRL